MSAHKKTPSVRAQGVSGNVINDQENNVMANISTATSNVIPFDFRARRRVRNTHPNQPRLGGVLAVPPDGGRFPLFEREGCHEDNRGHAPRCKAVRARI